MKAIAATMTALGVGACASVPAPEALPGPIIIDSAHNYRETVSRLDAAVAKRPLKVFAVIDHSGGAATVGLDLEPSRVLLFGNPRGGTPFMQANPAFGLELPLRVSVFQDNGIVRVAYPDIASLSQAYGISETDAPVAQIADTLDAIVGEATGDAS